MRLPQIQDEKGQAHWSRIKSIWLFSVVVFYEDNDSPKPDMYLYKNTILNIKV